MARTSVMPASPKANEVDSIESAHDEDAANDATGAVVGGSVRGMLWLFAKKISLKAMLRKRAFMTIGTQADGVVETSIARKPRASHSKVLVTSQSVLMSIVVFGTYDGLLHGWKHQHPDRQYTDFSMWVHGGAGAAAGISRSIVWIGWERFVNKIPHAPSFCWRTTIHHTTGYGALFGSYQGFRHFLLAALCQHDITDTESLVGTALAGGGAGQVHHVVQHYTSQWRLVRPNRIPPPRLYPTLTSFAPMALCFVAFEYAAEGVEYLLEYTDKVLESMELFQKHESATSESSQS